MRHQHEGREVEHLRIQPKVTRYAPVEYNIPLFDIFFEFHRVETDSVAPRVSDLSHFVLQFFKLSLTGHLIRVLNEFEVKLMEVGFNVDALQRGVRVFVHEHEVRVNFNAAVFSEH